MWRNRKHHSVFLSSLLLSLVAYWGQGSVAAHWLSSRPLRMSSKTNHQWEVKLLQCHSGNPRWSRHTSSAKDKKKKNVSQLVHWGLSLKPWMNKLNKSYKYDWECVHPESLKEQQSGFWASFILADCWPHGWGSWALRSSGCCERNTELCIWEGRGDWLLAPIPPPPFFTSFPIHWQIDEGISMKFRSRSAPQIQHWQTVGGVSLFPVFCTISQNWQKCHSPPSHPNGAGRWGRFRRLQQRCMLDDTLMTHLRLWNRPRVVMRYAASILGGWGPSPATPTVSNGVRRSPF